MLGNLKNPPEPFEDVIRTHFRLKANSIIKQLDGWLAEDDGAGTMGDGAGLGSIPKKSTPGGSSNGFLRDCEELKKLLRQLHQKHHLAHPCGFCACS